MSLSLIDDFMRSTRRYRDWSVLDSTAYKLFNVRVKKEYHGQPRG